MKNRSLGFSLPLIVVSVVMVTVLYGSAYFLYNKNSPRRESVPTISNNLVEEPSTPSSVPIKSAPQTTSKPTSSLPTGNADTSRTVITHDSKSIPTDRPFVYLMGDIDPTNPIQIKINGQSDFPTLHYNSTFSFEWNAPGAQKCTWGEGSVVTWNSGHDIASDKLLSKGSAQILASDYGNYAKLLHLSMNCWAYKNNRDINVGVNVGVLLDNPTAPSFVFSSPKQGDVLKRTANPNTYPPSHEISWTSSAHITGKAITLNRASDGHEVDPGIIGVQGLSFGSAAGFGKIAWRIPYHPAFPDGEYYFKVLGLNNVPVSIKGPTFRIVTEDTIPTYPQSGAVHDNVIKSQAYVEQNPGLCTEIGALQYRYECYDILASVVKDAAVCTLIPADYTSFLSTRNTCYYRLAQTLHDPSICDKIVENQNASIKSCKTLVNNAE